MTINQVATICHMANKGYCESIGDYSQPNWNDAPEWQQSSANNGVQFHLSNPNSLPSDSHKSWLKQKQKEGWKYGPIKNPETKEHPCFLPYYQLPEEQKIKDYIFLAIVRACEPFIQK